MLKKLKVLLHASVLTLAMTGAAKAEPISAGIAAFMAFASTPIGSLVMGVAFSLAGQLVTNLFGPKPQEQKERGTQLSLRVGGDGPLSFPLGPSATAGTRVYVGSWGNSGGTPNAYFVDVIAVSDLPVSGFTGFWVNDEKATLGTLNATLGYPVTQYRRGGKDHVWIKYHTGTQTTPDAYLRDKFGSHPVYPFTADMIGRGVAYIIVTTLLPAQDDRDLISQPPRVLAELGSINLYDPRKDSSRGGDGDHRWGQYDTYEPSSNRYVQAYNVARGIYYGSEWVFGGQNWPAFRLPLSSWFAAMNAADLAIPLEGGGTEPQFHGGGMVEADMEPAAVIEECLKSASGLIAEVGGIYKVRAGAPGVPVMSFTDEDIIVTKEQGYRPFVGMEDTYNIVNATYTERGERWARKEAPQLRDSDMIDEDDGRELPIGIDYPTVHSNTTVQRLIQTALRNARRFRTHVHYLPPQAWLLEPLDVVAWTSARNGYVAKDFDIEEIEGGSNFLQMVRLRENDPGDYDWNPATDEQPWSVATLETIRPAPQPMTGWQVAQATIRDSENNARRPSIEVSYASGLEDVMAVRVQVRLKATEAVVFDGEVPYAPPYAVTLNGVFLPNETYEVRGRYVPYSTRLTEWSAWIEVTTPPVKLTDLDIELSNIARNVLEQMGVKPRQLIEMFKQFGTLLEEVDRENYTKREALFREISVELEGLEASFTEIIEVALGPGGAIAQALESLYAAMGGNTAEVNVRWQAQAAPSGYSARYAVQAAVNDGTFRAATFFLDVPEDPDQPTRIGLMAGQTAFFTSDGTPIVAISEDGKLRSANGSFEVDMITGDLVSSGNFSFG